MGAKDKKQPVSDHSSEEEFEGDQDQQMDIQEEVIKKIKALPTLKEKVQAIAINSYLIQKRQIDAKLQRQTQELTQKFIASMGPQIEIMNKIIQGTYDFTNADFEDCNDLLTGEELATTQFYSTKQPIPEYWLKVFLNSDVLGEQVQQVDEPILKHLVKIQAEKSADLTKFSVTFYFSQNEWFSNQKISKHFDIEETQIKKSHGDQINWKAGKNVTVKVVKKKGKKGGAKTKQVKQPSFFNLFKQIEMKSDEEDNQAEQQNEDDEVEQLQLQFEMCDHLYEVLIPRSLEYYLDIALPQGFEGGCCEQQGCEHVADGKKSGKKGGNQADESDDQ